MTDLPDVQSQAAQLRPVMARPPGREYAAELWRRREFIITAPRNQLRATNMDTVLGNLWFLVNPALQMIVYWLMFGVLLDVDRGVDNYIGYLVVGVLTFSYVTGALMASARCMDSNLTLIRSMYFPRAVIPISTLLSNLYTFVPSLLVMIVVVVATGELPTWRWLLLPVIVAGLSLLLLGVVFITARIGKQLPDLHTLLPHLTRLLFYCSGVLFAPAAFTSNELALLLFDINPFFDFVELLRWSLMGRPVEPQIWIFASIWMVALSTFGAWFFWRRELSYGTT